jgi:desulfoferrodoxin (superoxide reductase-like protein)
MPEPCRLVCLRTALLASSALAGLSLACGNADNTQSATAVPEWQQVADGLESSAQCCWSAGELPTGDDAGAPEAHLPIISLLDGDILRVGFEQALSMTSEHWITTVYVRDQDGIVIGFRDFGQYQLLPQFADDPVPVLEFPAPLRTEWVRAYSYCNLHQHWVSDVLGL